jgi:hypothetical protein
VISVCDIHFLRSDRPLGKSIVAEGIAREKYASGEPIFRGMPDLPILMADTCAGCECGTEEVGDVRRRGERMRARRGSGGNWWWRRPAAQVPVAGGPEIAALLLATPHGHGNHVAMALEMLPGGPTARHAPPSSAQMAKASICGGSETVKPVQDAASCGGRPSARHRIARYPESTAQVTHTQTAKLRYTGTPRVRQASPTQCRSGSP